MFQDSENEIPHKGVWDLFEGQRRLIPWGRRFFLFGEL